MTFAPQPPRQYLLECFDLDLDTGLLTWRARPRHHFKTDAHWKVWAGRWAGVPAFREPDKDGYLMGRLDGKRRKAHRLIWKMLHGVEPLEIDHIDGDKANNRPDNLRSVTKSENMRNAPRPRANISGVVGVSQRRGKWSARIKRNRRNIYLGDFHRFEDAVAARKAAEERFGFHPNHGRAPCP